MTDTNNHNDRNSDLENSVKDEPESKHGKQGQAANGGDQAGPNSDESGRTIAPGMGNPRGDDRAGS